MAAVQEQKEGGNTHLKGNAIPLEPLHHVHDGNVFIMCPSGSICSWLYLHWADWNYCVLTVIHTKNNSTHQ